MVAKEEARKLLRDQIPKQHSEVETSIRMFQGQTFIPSVLIGLRGAQHALFNKPTLRILHTVYDALGHDRQLRNSARLTDNLRMTVYSYLKAQETLTKPAVLSRRERKLLGQSAIAR